jgi:hypothetical protein
MPPPKSHPPFFFLFFGADQLGVIIYHNLIAYVKQIPNHLPPPTPKEIIDQNSVKKIQFIFKLFGHPKGLNDPLTQHTK